MNHANTEEVLVYSYQRKVYARYIGGPIPLSWVERAASLGGNAIEAGLVLWYRWGLNKKKPFKIGNADLSFSGKSADTGRRALRALKTAGLIEVREAPGQKALVKIVLPREDQTNDRKDENREDQNE